MQVEFNKNEAGNYMCMYAWRSDNDVDVVFEDGSRVFGTTHRRFKNGNVIKPEKRIFSDWIGEKSADSDGNIAEIIEIPDEEHITVRYDNGDILSEITLNDFIAGDFGVEYEQTEEEKILLGEKRKKATIAEERKRTYDNVVYMLRRYRRCVLIRPCSFGKTEIALKLFKREEYRKCLFLHTNNDERNSSRVNGKAEIKTYQWLGGRSDEQLRSLDYDLVVFDECHRIGGDDDGKGAYIWFTSVKKLMMYHPKTHFLGCTATPNRMDGIDVTESLFLNHTCYPYTYTDAYDDGLLTAPYYYYSVYDVEKRLRDISEKEELKLDRDAAESILNHEEIKKIDARRMPQHIRKYCNQNVDTSYMRFIVFYLQIEDIRENKDKVVQWFRDAYPDHEVCAMEVHSASKENIQAIDELPVIPGRIDLIFNCEMLCTSYHSKHITGLVMERKTRSFTKYQQMIGRLLSCDSSRPAIIFDVVDNFHADFVFNSIPVPEIYVVPSESKRDYTYQELLEMYPHAIHWERIAEHNIRIAREDAIRIAKAKRTVKTMSDVPALKDSSGIDKLLDIYSSAHSTEQKLDIPGLVYGLETTFMPENFGLTVESASEDESPLDDAIEKDLGYQPGVYDYDPRSRSLIRIDQSCEVIPAEEILSGLLKRSVYPVINAILDKWHTYPGCEENYHSLDEINTKSHKYKFLKICAENLSACSVNSVIKYMVDEVDVKENIDQNV